MQIDDFRAKLQAEPDEYSFTEENEKFIVEAKRWGTKFEIEYKAIEDNDWQMFLDTFKGGRDIDHITRVTGYYAKVKSFNKGKVQELKDRYKSVVRE